MSVRAMSSSKNRSGMGKRLPPFRFILLGVRRLEVFASPVGRGLAPPPSFGFSPVGPDALIGPLAGFCARGISPLHPILAFPLGGRWHGEAVTDEGADFGLGLLYAERFRRPGGGAGFRPAGRVTFPAMGKSPKDRRGRLRMSASRSYSPYPRTPLRGTRTCEGVQNFRRAKSEWLIQIPAGPLGPGFPKIAIDAVHVLRLALPSQRFRCVSWREAQGPPLPKIGRCP